MQTGFQSTAQRGRVRIPLWLGFCLFLAIALFFLLEEHRAHILGALPYVLLLLCPIIHMFMHHDHGGHGVEHPHREGDAGRRQGEGGES